MQDISVLYDIASLGMARISGGHRTGIGGAAEDLVRALARQRGCTPILMASDFQGDAADVAARRLEGIEFAHSAWQRSLSRLLYRFYPLKLMTDTTWDDHLGVRLKRLGVKASLAPVRPVLRRLGAGTLARADVYHSASGVVPAQLASSQRRGKKLPIFVTVHDMIGLKHPEFFAAGRITSREQMLSAFTPERWYLCSSENTMADLLETGRCDPSRVLVTPLAAGEEYAPKPDADGAIRARYGLGEDPYFLSVCTLEPRKNLDLVIRAFTRLVREERGRIPDGLKLALVGAAGWRYQKVNQAYQDAGDAKKRIIFTGYARGEDLPALYSEALAFVYVSLYEGFGLPPLEAMRCGAPVIASNVSSLPEVVGDAGILQDPRDVEGLAENLRALSCDPALRADLSRRALAQAEKFSWDRCARLTLDAYRTALASSG